MDPDSDQLSAKIELLQERLNDKKEMLLEKELVLDEVTTLSTKLALQGQSESYDWDDANDTDVPTAAHTRSSTLEVAKKVNQYQSKIRGTTREALPSIIVEGSRCPGKIMATVSELSMYQASAMKLEQERLAKV